MQLLPYPRWTEAPRSAHRRCAAIGGLLTNGRQELTVGHASVRHVETIEVHDLIPRRHEVPYELLLSVVTGVHLGECAQLRIRPEDEIHGGSGPPGLAGR